MQNLILSFLLLTCFYSEAIRIKIPSNLFRPIIRNIFRIPKKQILRNPDQLFNHGMKYYQGQERLPQSYKKAAHWFEKAAEQGNVNAQLKLGMMYTQGKGVLKDSKEAAHWFKKAALQGYSNAQFNLGVMYYQGEGVLQEYKKAAHWFKKAALQEDATAQYHLGIMYIKGIGVKQDSKQAIYWLKKSNKAK